MDVAVYCYEDKLFPYIWPVTPGDTSSNHTLQSRRLCKDFRLKNKGATLWSAARESDVLY